MEKTTETHFVAQEQTVIVTVTCGARTRAAGMFFAALALAGALGGCGGPSPIQEAARVFQIDGKPALAAGIRDYENARYKEAIGRLQDALDAGLDRPGQVSAHRHLALAFCGQTLQRQCRAHFRLALELDPSLKLSAEQAQDPGIARAFREASSRPAK